MLLVPILTSILAFQIWIVYFMTNFSANQTAPCSCLLFKAWLILNTPFLQASYHSFEAVIVAWIIKSSLNIIMTITFYLQQHVILALNM